MPLYNRYYRWYMQRMEYDPYACLCGCSSWTYSSWRLLRSYFTTDIPMDNASKIRHLTNAKARYMQLKDPNPTVVKAYDNEINRLENANDLPPKREQKPQLQAIPPSNQADKSS